MGYRYVTPMGEEFSGVTTAGADRLVRCLQQIGFKMGTKRKRVTGDGTPLRRKFSLKETLLGVNDGIKVSAEESARMYSALHRIAEQCEDPGFIYDVSQFFLSASRHGGFYVW